MESPGELKAIATSDVDDNSDASNPAWLKESFVKFSECFGGATRRQPPINYAEVERERMEFGIHMAHDDFCQDLQHFPQARLVRYRMPCLLPRRS